MKSCTLTLAQVTSAMLRTEKLINWYNTKYNFDMTKATQKQQREYRTCLTMWDTFKSYRDSLKAVA